MYKIVMTLFSTALLIGCAGGQLKVEEAKRIKKVAIVGFTMDYTMSFNENLKSTLKGEQSNEGRPGGIVTIDGSFGKADPLAAYTYNEAFKSLSKMGWDVLSYKETLRSPSLKKYYNRKVKKGYFPLTRGKKRLGLNGIPQHYYIQGLRKSPVLDAITKELKVDALVFLYSNTNKKCIGVAGNCVNTPKYSSNILFNTYDALSDKTLINMNFNGPKVKKLKSPYQNLSKIKSSMLASNKKAFDGFAKKLNQKIK